MAWTAPTTRSTGDLITASIWNTDLVDDLTYLKGVVDTAIQKDGSVTYTGNQPMGSKKLTGLAAGSATGDSARWDELHSYSSTDVTASRAVDTVYQNTNSKYMLAVIHIYVTHVVAAGTGCTYALLSKIGNANPPTTEIAYSYWHLDTDQTDNLSGGAPGTVIMLIPPSYYYAIYKTIDTGTNGMTFHKWYEHIMH